MMPSCRFVWRLQYANHEGMTHEEVDDAWTYTGGPQVCCVVAYHTMYRPDGQRNTSPVEGTGRGAIRDLSCRISPLSFRVKEGLRVAPVQASRAQHL